jgi:signal peptidase I
MRSFVRELIGTLVIAIIVFLLLRLVVGSYAVISQSMEPGIQAGQRLLINKLAYKFHEPVRGDIVFYKSPEGDLDQMKRIIGLPGDIIEMHDRAVFLNGHQMTEPYVTNQAGYSIPEYQVPPGNYFVLGDNRNNSTD